MAGSDYFAHIQVASAYSLQYGTTHPDALVQRAAELDQNIIGLTDRNGLYGAVQWARACMAAGIAPVLGVDLAVERTEHRGISGAGIRRTPAHGGVWVDETHPRVTFLATGARRVGVVVSPRFCSTCGAAHLAGTAVVGTVPASRRGGGTSRG